METSFLGYILAAFFGAVFGVGGNLILRYLTSGKVTPDHLKKEDLNEMKEEFKRHIDRHVDCEKDFVKQSDFDKHLHQCPVKDIEKNLIDHEISHGRHDSEIFTRLKTIEKQIIESSGTFSKLTEGLHEVDKKLGMMVQKMDWFIENKSAWVERNDS